MKRIDLQLIFIGRKEANMHFESQIDNLTSVGPKTRELLLNKFQSFNRIQRASEKDLIELLGKVRGKSLFKQLKS